MYLGIRYRHGLQAEVIVWQIVEAIEYAVFYPVKFPEGNILCAFSKYRIRANISYVAKNSAYPISQGKDFESNHLKLVKDIYKDMKYFIIETFPEVEAKVGESAFTGDMIHWDAGVDTVSPASIFIM